MNDQFLLKIALISSPILIHPRFNDPFELHCDASNLAIGAALMQKRDDSLYPIAYYSKKLKNAELNYSTSEKEALSIVTAIKHFSYYLSFRHFTVITDHAPFCSSLTKIKSNSRRISRWATFLQIYDFDVKFTSGKTNVLPDFLSRNPIDAPMTLNSFQTNETETAVFETNNVICEQNWDIFCKNLIDFLKGRHVINPPAMRSLDEFMLDEHGVLYFLPKHEKERTKLRLCVPVSLQSEALKIAHIGITKSHCGFLKTLHRLKQDFFFPNMITAIKRYCS
jgi:hypothetical protein